MNVVVLGAGYAGVTLTRLLERSLPPDVTLTLVDESAEHLIQHELHHVIRHPAVADEIVLSLTELLETASVRVARVESIDRDRRTVALDDGSIEYDVCAICLGAKTAFYGLSDVREHATPLKRLEHAHEIRRDLLDVLSTAEIEASEEQDATEATGLGESRSPPRIVVGGAGLSGIQAAGEIAEVIRDRNESAEVVLLERFETVAPNFPANFQEAVGAALSGRGVDVRTDATVVGASETHVRLDGEDDLRYDQFVWTGGIRGSAALGLKRPTVRSDLRLDDRTFLLGDAARVVDATGEAVPASAQSAVREARIVAENVRRLVEYEREGDVFEPPLERFDFESPGWLVSVGDDAVAQVGPSVITGTAARALKTTVGAGYLSAIGSIGRAAEKVTQGVRSELPSRNNARSPEKPE